MRFQHCFIDEDMMGRMCQLAARRAARRPCVAHDFFMCSLTSFAPQAPQGRVGQWPAEALHARPVSEVVPHTVSGKACVETRV